MNKRISLVLISSLLIFFLFGFVSAGFFNKVTGKASSINLPEASSSPCSDSDGGINYNLTGTVHYIENGVEYDFTDSCHRYVVGDYLYEGYCNGSNFEIDYALTPAGYICLNGKFVMPIGEYIGCQETDLYPNPELGGNDPMKSGRTYYWTNPQYKKLAKDFCRNESEGTQSNATSESIVEYYCHDYGDGTFDLKQQVYECNCQEFGSAGAKCLNNPAEEQQQAQKKNQVQNTEKLRFKEKVKVFFASQYKSN